MNQLLCKKKVTDIKPPSLPLQNEDAINMTNVTSASVPQEGSTATLQPGIFHLPLQTDVNETETGIVFPKAGTNPNMFKLQILVRDFITSLILKNEQTMHKIITQNGYDMSYLLTTNKVGIDLIKECTEDFFNSCYNDLQDEKITVDTTTILEMSYLAEYSPHILLNKLIQVTLDVHIGVVRENLSHESVDKYFHGVQAEIEYQFLSSVNLIYILSKGLDDDEDFINIGNGGKAFEVVIDKHIEQ